MRLEELRVTEGQLNHLTNLGHLLSAAADIVVANLVEVVLLLVALDRLALAVDDGILGDNAVLWRIHLHHLELDLPHAATDDEEIALPDGSVGLTEVWGKVDIEERAGDTLDGIGDGENRNALGLEEEEKVIRSPSRLGWEHFRALTYLISGQGWMVTISPCLTLRLCRTTAVESGAALIKILIGEDNQDGVLPLLSPDEDGISAEEAKSIHGLARKGR